MKLKSQTVAIYLLLVPQLVLSLFYILNVYDYFWGDYSYDGLRFPLFVLLIDVIFVVVILITRLALRMPKSMTYWSICSLIANNIVLGIGVEYVAFVGLLICICSFISLKFFMSSAQDG